MLNKLDVCSRCVMDSSDTEIIFNSEGVCNHCLKFDEITSKRWFPGPEGQDKLQKSFEKIKEQGRGKDYDCIIGLSGGVDSSYLAFVLKDYGLRPLVVHVDAGWNSELAVSNIEKIVKYCNFDLFTHVMDWEEVRDLQLSYLKSGVANQDVVQDHAYFSTLYHHAVKHGIKCVISGGNIATESVFPASWHHSAMDAINLHAIHNKFGSLKLKAYKTISFFQYYLFYPYIYKMKTFRPLNFIPYDKDQALKTLEEKVGYKDYGRKHGESVFTRFFQNHYLPKKFGYDKRKPHLSSLILSGQMVREEALLELARPLYSESEISKDIAYISKKLRVSSGELNSLIEGPGRSYTEFKNWDFLYSNLKSLQASAEKLLGKKINNYG